MLPIKWWDTATIEWRVSRPFVFDHLLAKEIERLDRPLNFGKGLTDGTYWEWIESKAKRIFLILVDLGLPDQIFGLIDDSWEDADLPIARDQVWRLKLTAKRNEKIDMKFYHRQFHYLLKPLEKDDHRIYEHDEVIAVEFPDKKHAADQKGETDTVMLPNHPGLLFSRRRVPLGPRRLSWEDFLKKVNELKKVQHEHLFSYWASYTHRDYGYILLTPAAEFSLKSLFTTMPSCVKELDKRERRETVMNWIHCLVNTVYAMHTHGLSHGNIKPSTVLFSKKNCVFLSDFNPFHVDMLGKMTDKERSSFDKEAYDYAPPEKWFKPIWSFPTSENAPAPQPNPQAGDVFSLGCVMLELLSFLAKKQGRPFASHRAKTLGRPNAIPDASFHKNLGQVETWMTRLDEELSKKDDPIFIGISPVLHAIAQMLAFQPAERPTIHEVQEKMNQIITVSCGISEPHCMPEDEDDDDASVKSVGQSVRQSASRLTATSGIDTTSISTKRTSAPQSGDDKRTSVPRSGDDKRTSVPRSGDNKRSSYRSGYSGAYSGGSGGRDNSLDWLLEGPEGEAGEGARTRSASEFSRGTLGIQHMLAKDNGKRWPAPGYDGKFFTLFDK